MKKILVPTDFSDAAGYASNVAVKIAPALSAEVHFFTRTPGKREGAFFEVTEENRHEAPMNVKDHFDKLLDTYKDSGVNFRMIYSHQSLIDAINDYVNDQEIDMVVMGSSGASGIKELLAGSHAQKVVNRVECPVLVIKHEIREPEFKNVVFASDFRKEARKPFQNLIDLAAHFGSHLHLVHVVTHETTPVEEYLARKKMGEFEKLCFKVPCSTHFSGDVQIESGIKNFASKNKVDLIAVVSHGESALQKLVKGGSIAEALVKHLEFPVLTLSTKA